LRFLESLLRERIQLPEQLVLSVGQDLEVVGEDGALDELL
jgi:hypothetical protein